MKSCSWEFRLLYLWIKNVWMCSTEYSEVKNVFGKYFFMLALKNNNALNIYKSSKINILDC